MFGIKDRIKGYINKLVVESLLPHSGKPTYPAADILTDLYGYAKTVELKVPVAADGSPLPWYTYPAIEYFNQIDAKGLRIFEYGSGNSSLYWAHKGADIWSVEHDQTWYESMRYKSGQLKDLYFRDAPEQYASAIADVGNNFDIVVLDGAWRNECASAALPYLRQDGIFVLDNSDWYTDVAGFLRSKGFFQIDFNGFGPINNYCWTTSILLPMVSSLTNRLNYPRPIGGIEVFKGEKW